MMKMNKHDFKIYLRNTMSEILRKWQEAYPGNKFLSFGISMSKNGNDDGDWNCWYMNAFNDTELSDNERFDYYWYEDVEDEKYYACYQEDHGPIEAVRW